MSFIHQKGILLKNVDSIINNDLTIYISKNSTLNGVYRRITNKMIALKNETYTNIVD